MSCRCFRIFSDFQLHGVKYIHFHKGRNAILNFNARMVVFADINTVGQYVSYRVITKWFAVFTQDFPFFQVLMNIFNSFAVVSHLEYFFYDRGRYGVNLKFTFFIDNVTKWNIPTVP